MFLFGPGKLRRQLRKNRADRLRGSRLIQQFPNHGVERFDSGRLGLPLISGEHRAKTIRGGKDQLREVRATGMGNLRSEHILELMGELAQFVKSTSRGIALQGMHGATDTTDHFLVSGARLEFESSLVERLKQFVGALKKESAQLATAILGKTTHAWTSLRW